MSETILSRPVWSRSQFSSLKECQRKFYLSSRPTTSLFLNMDPPTFSQVGRLKKMKNRHLWIGSILHETIGNVLKTVRKGSPLPPSQEMIDQVRKKMRQEFLDSRQLAESPFRLFEHEYQVSIKPEEWLTHWTQVEKSLLWFFNSAWLHRLKDMGPETWKAVDEILDFDVDGVKAYVKIDCALEVGGRFVVIDWKTSTLRHLDESSLRLAALYAHEVWSADVEAIDCYMVSLQDGQRLQANITEDSLLETHLRIQEEAGLLQEAMERSPSNIFEVPMTSQLSFCRRCNFQQICHPQGLPLS